MRRKKLQSKLKYIIHKFAYIKIIYNCLYLYNNNNDNNSYNDLMKHMQTSRQ